LHAALVLRAARSCRGVLTVHCHVRFRVDADAGRCEFVLSVHSRSTGTLRTDARYMMAAKEG